MFKLLKSEIEYYKISLILITGIILIANIYLTITNKWEAVFINMDKDGKILFGIFTIYYVIYAQLNFTINRVNKNRRLAMQKTLPISNFGISLFRLLYLMFLWVIPVLILSFFYILNVREPFNYQWLQIIGFMTLFYFLFLLNILITDDLIVLILSEQNVFFRFFSKISVYLIVFLLNYFIVAKVKFDIHHPAAIIKPIIKNYFLTERGIEVNLIIAVVLMIVSVISFNKRKSFL